MSESNKRLDGKTILNTRSENQAAETTAAIAQRGGTAMHLPCLELECLEPQIRQALPLLRTTTAELLFTSRNGVACVARLLGEQFELLLAPRRVTAIGEKTAQALARCGITAQLLPETASQQGLIETYRQRGIPDKLIFFRAEEGGDALSEMLGAAGCTVTTIHAYRMRCPEGDAGTIVRQMENQAIDGVLLGSPKTVRHYIQRIGNVETANIPAIAVISPAVAEVAQALGLSVQAIAKTASFDAMLDALADYFDKSGA